MRAAFAPALLRRYARLFQGAARGGRVAALDESEGRTVACGCPGRFQNIAKALGGDQRGFGASAL